MRENPQWSQLYFKPGEEMSTMTVEYLGARIFLDEIGATGEIWVARSSLNSIYAVSIDRAGFSLPVWSSSGRSAEYLRNARLVGPKYEPHAVSLEAFTAEWLSDQRKAIVELQINPDGKSARVLVMSPDEFRAAQEKKPGTGAG
jgi:hypothetical protein